MTEEKEDANGNHSDIRGEIKPQYNLGGCQGDSSP